MYQHVRYSAEYYWGQRDHSMLTFETAAVQGVSGIIEKLTVRLDQSGTSHMDECIYIYAVTSFCQGRTSSLHS